MDSKISINFIHLEANGIIGNHKAPVNQILLIVQGEAIVSSKNHTSVSVSKNTAVFFEAGEMHETRTNNGLNAVIIERPDLKDDLFHIINKFSTLILYKFSDNYKINALKTIKGDFVCNDFFLIHQLDVDLQVNKTFK
ncbi:hypothetical protein QA540_05535 [Macrococcus psychrotolerans]|uniref:AraC-type arabinose-binding/dimerisation domain-containing protein n=1 Tax=Macrococcus psychrotolerans TaxID=3039389 RepID=A0AAU6RCN4_9STAP